MKWWDFGVRIALEPVDSKFFNKRKSGSVLLIRQLREMLEMEAAKRSLKGVC